MKFTVFRPAPISLMVVMDQSNKLADDNRQKDPIYEAYLIVKTE